MPGVRYLLRQMVRWADPGESARLPHDARSRTGLVGGWRTIAEIPAETPVSKAMSKELKRRGFRFVGPTVCYAFMQAAGLVNDHTVDCFRYLEVSE